MSDESIFTTRREFLSGSLTFLSAAATLPAFLGNTSRVLAAADPKKGKQDAHRILVVVQLAGGNDGLNTVVPYEMDGYYRNRQQLAIAKKDVLKLEQNFGLHPACTPLKELFDDGKMAIVQGVGYPNPDRSHFTSMDVWHTADPTQKKHEGWLGRYFDACCAGKDPGPQPIEGIALMQETPLAMLGDSFTPLSFNSPDTLTWRGGSGDAKAAETFRSLNNIDGDWPRSGPELEQFLQRAALDAQLGAEKIRSAGGSAGRGRRNRGGGRESLSGQLQMVARMIAADLPTRVYYVSMGGFDTHSGQAGRHQQLLRQFSEAMQDFLETLAEDKQLDRVLVLTFSEFGRRVQENASGGTDHGEAAPMFLFGSKVRAGIHEKHPDLEALHRGDLSFGCDFRRVYAAVLKDWFKLAPDRVLGRGFAPLRVLKA